MRTGRRRLKRKTPLIICCLLLLTMLAGCYVAAKNKIFPSVPGAGSTPDLVSDPLKNERLNVLLLGIDARQGETMARTDSIILASVDQKSKQVVLLSIPRDTRVNIPGYGYDKINSASVYGGPELSMKVASELLGIPIKYYVLVNFSGFKYIVDALGGVTMNVEQDMYHWDDTDGGAYEINLKKGVQRLDGEKALQYVRYRDYAMGDIERTQHQQKFLVALAKEVLQPGTIAKLPKLVPEINRYIKTNLSIGYLYTLASASRDLEKGNIITQTLPGRPVDINGGSYWGVDPSEARQMLARLFNGETVTNVVLSTPLSSQYTGAAGVKPATQPKTEATKSTTIDQSRQPSAAQAQQDQSGTGTAGNQKTGKAGQGTQSSSSGSAGGTVIITPGGSGSAGASSGTSTNKPGKSGGEAEVQSRTGTSSLPSGSSTDEGKETVNPAIPGTKVKM